MLKDLLQKNEYSKYFAAIAYVPFVGWLIPLYAKSDDSFCQENSKQGFVLALIFAGMLLSLSLLNVVFLPREWRIMRFLVVILIYFFNISYFVLCITGIAQSLMGKRLSLPVIEHYTGKLKL